MSDRELLEAAARAVGIKLADEIDSHIPSGGVWVVGRGGRDAVWDPLGDDGDALRLAVELNLHIGIDAESAGAITIEWDFDGAGTARRSLEQDAPVGGDDYAATRRAIVRAAAALSPPPVD